MKKNIILSIIALSLLYIASCNLSNPVKQAALTFEIEGKTGDTAITLLIYNYKRDVVDSVKITKNGKYEVDAKWERPQILEIRDMRDVNYSFATFLSNKNVNIKIKNINNNVIADSDFIFSYENDSLVDKYISFQQPFDLILNEEDSLNIVWQKLRQKYTNIPTEIRKPFDSIYELNYNKKVNYLDNYAKNHNNIVSHYLYLTSLRFTYKFKELEKIVENIKDTNNVYAKALIAKKDILRHLQIGSVAPDLLRPDTAGNPIALSSLRGKYVLLDFWASWCGPCRKENPWVKKAYEKYHDKGFDVYAVSLDYPNGRKQWIEAIKHDQLPWHHVSNLQGWNDSVAIIYNISGIPYPFFLDPEGKIIAKGNDVREQKLLDLLKKYCGNKK